MANRIFTPEGDVPNGMEGAYEEFLAKLRTTWKPTTLVGRKAHLNEDRTLLFTKAEARHLMLRLSEDRQGERQGHVYGHLYGCLLLPPEQGPVHTHRFSIDEGPATRAFKLLTKETRRKLGLHLCRDRINELNEDIVELRADMKNSAATFATNKKGELLERRREEALLVRRRESVRELLDYLRRS